MEKKDLIESEVEKTLQIIDRIERVDANPYLYGKVIHKLDGINPIEKKFNLKLALTVVVVCLFTNLAVLLFYQSDSSTNDYYYNVSDSTRTAQIKSFASEYSSTNNFYFY